MSKILMTHTTGSSITTPDATETALFIEADSTGNGVAKLFQPDGTIVTLGSNSTVVNGVTINNYSSDTVYADMSLNVSGSYTLLPQIPSASFAIESLYWVGTNVNTVNSASAASIYFTNVDGDGPEVFTVQVWGERDIKRVVFPDGYTSKEAIDLNNAAWTCGVSVTSSWDQTIRVVARGTIVTYGSV